MSTDSARPARATAMIDARVLHGEVLDPRTRDVWQSLEPITREDYESLPLEPGWLRIGIGAGAMDEHWFTRSPGATEDGPMALREIGGRRFGLCARPASPPTQPAGPDGPRRLLVDKHHVIRFAVGRGVPVLRDPQGNRFVHVVEGGENKPPLVTPDGWTLEHHHLTNDWIVSLPTPTTVYFFPNGDSFQGPVPDEPA